MKNEFTQEEVKSAIARVFGCEDYEVETPPPDNQALHPQMASFVRTYAEPGSCGTDYAAYVSADTIAEILCGAPTGKFIVNPYDWTCKFIVDR